MCLQLYAAIGGRIEWVGSLGWFLVKHKTKRPDNQEHTEPGQAEEVWDHFPNNTAQRIADALNFVNMYLQLPQIQQTVSSIAILELLMTALTTQTHMLLSYRAGQGFSVS